MARLNQDDREEASHFLRSARRFLPGASRLTPDQRREFSLGWLNWLGAESLGVVVAILKPHPEPRVWGIADTLTCARVRLGQRTSSTPAPEPDDLGAMVPSRED
jgi:hypothetical protein